MLQNILIAPSVNSLFVTGLLVLFIFITALTHVKQIIKLPYYQKIVLLSAMTVAVGIHGLIHLGVEVNYNLNPYNWIYTLEDLKWDRV
jgi:uncharacterized membrane protein